MRREVRPREDAAQQENLMVASLRTVFRTEEYMLKSWCFRTLTSRFGKPSVDCFASVKQHQPDITEWWGEGSHTVQNAFSVNWSYRRWGLIYMNPPWTMLQKAVDKILRDKARAIIVVPHYTTTSRFHTVMLHARQRYFFNGPQPLFTDIEGKDMPPPKWHVWGVLMQHEWVNPEDYDFKNGSARRLQDQDAWVQKAQIAEGEKSIEGDNDSSATKVGLLA